MSERAPASSAEVSPDSTGRGPTDPEEPPELSRRAAHRATWVLIAVRAGYAYNWFTIGPALPAIGAAYNVGPAEWGLLIAAFLIAAGLLQVPAGILSRRYGSRTVALWGAALLGVASIASAFAPSFDILVAMRLLAGAGAALFFSPAIGLVGSLFPEGKRGLPVGTFSSAFSGGAAAGVFFSAILVGAVGWRADIALGGVGLLVLTLIAFLVIPRAAGAPARRPRPRIPHALKLPALWAIGIAFIGLEAASFATGQFIVPYGTLILGWSAAVAGAVGIAFILPSVAGGPVGGMLAERSARRRAQFVIASLVVAVLVVAIPWVGLVPMLFIGSVFAFCYGFIYAVMYVLPAYLPGLPTEEIPIGIGLFNSIQLSGGAIVSWFFGWLVAVEGYTVAWTILGLLVVVPLAVLKFVPPTRGARPRAGLVRPEGVAEFGPAPELSR
jgi:predicted MFS family arabinose efflux permease